MLLLCCMAHVRKKMKLVMDIRKRLKYWRKIFVLQRFASILWDVEIQKNLIEILIFKWHMKKQWLQKNIYRIN